MRKGRKEETVRGEERGGPEEDATYYSCRPEASPMAPSEKMDGLRMRQRERESGGNRYSLRQIRDR